MSAPLVSVLIPCYNAASTIGETLTSVLAQTWPHIEIIVVDDGSSDESAAVAATFGGDKIRILCQANRGQTAALNVALRCARGEFVQYIDADDLISPDKIALQMQRLTAEPDCVASAEWGRFRHRAQDARFEPETVWRDLAPLDWLAGARARGADMMFPALWLMPMALVRRIGPWREDLTLNNDAEYFTRALLAARRVLFCPGARCYYRSGSPSSLSGRKSPAAWASQFQVLDLCESHVLAREDSERIRRGFALSWRHLAHGAYPYDSALAERALARAAQLHDIRVAPDGGPAFRLAARLVGWRLARRLQVMSGRP